MDDVDPLFVYEWDELHEGQDPPPAWLVMQGDHLDVGTTRPSLPVVQVFEACHEELELLRVHVLCQREDEMLRAYPEIREYMQNSKPPHGDRALIP